MYHSGHKHCAIVRPGRHARRASGRFPVDIKVPIGAYESWEHPLQSVKSRDPYPYLKIRFLYLNGYKRYVSKDTKRYDPYPKI